MPIAQRRMTNARERTNAGFGIIKSIRNVCLRLGSGKQYSLQRAVAQLGSALEWGSRGRGFKSRRPDFSLCMAEDNSKHRCCFCDKTVLSPDHTTPAVFVGDPGEQDAAQAIFCYKGCLHDQVSKSGPLHPDIVD